MSSEHAKRPVLDVISLLVALAALAGSALSLHNDEHRGRDTSAQTLIHDQYELCRVLDQLRLEQPQVSHMLALPVVATGTPATRAAVWENYRLFRAYAATAETGGDAQPKDRRNRLYLQEHAMALHVFDIYEQTVFQRELARKGDNPERTDVLDSLVTYYEEKMLRNPRLRYHWVHGGADMMEDSTRSRYAERVGTKHADTDFVDGKTPFDNETFESIGQPTSMR